MSNEQMVRLRLLAEEVELTAVTKKVAELNYARAQAKFTDYVLELEEPRKARQG